MSAVRGARIQALQLVDRTNKAGRLLADGKDEDALHQFRVALRRLRTFLRGYASHLSVTKKIRGTLRRLARRTNAARDLEVSISWLKEQRPALKVRERIGLDLLLQDLERHRDKAYASIRERVLKEWRPVERELKKFLSGTVKDQPVIQTFAQTSAELASEYSYELEMGLSLLERQQKQRVAHRARIRGKRLRYLLEPMGRTVPGVQSALTALKRLQDDLGLLNDSGVLLEKLSEAAEAFSAKRVQRLLDLATNDNPNRARISSEMHDDALPGLLALARRAKIRREQALLKVMENHVLGRATIIDLVRQVATRLGDQTNRPSRPQAKKIPQRQTRRKVTTRARRSRAARPRS
jgi:CHAD domain-containing protein